MSPPPRAQEPGQREAPASRGRELEVGVKKARRLGSWTSGHEGERGGRASLYEQFKR